MLNGLECLTSDQLVSKYLTEHKQVNPFQFPGSTKYQKKKSFYQKSGKAGQPGKIYQFRGKFYQQKF